MLTRIASMERLRFSEEQTCKQGGASLLAGVIRSKDTVGQGRRPPLTRFGQGPEYAAYTSRSHTASRAEVANVNIHNIYLRHWARSYLLATAHMRDGVASVHAHDRARSSPHPPSPVALYAQQARAEGRADGRNRAGASRRAQMGII
eukprot:6193453-Pleurochrysis_carterae.AAC.7